MVYFRKRLGLDNISAINEMVAGIEKEDQDNDDDNDDDTPKNKGTMLFDAPCAPSDIRYPTDLGLLVRPEKKPKSFIAVLKLKKDCPFSDSPFQVLPVISC